MKEIVRVIIVDQPGQVKAITRALNREETIQIIDSAATGYEAITKVMTQAPDVVLMNVSIETKMAGVFVCREINQNRPDTKVILYGEDGRNDIVFKAVQMGAVNFLRGDYSDAELIEAVLSAARGRSSIHHGAAPDILQEFRRILDLHDNLVYVINVLVKLTPAEITILRHFYNGMKSQEIANVLFISNTTMKTHVSHILKKFNLEKMTQVVDVLRLTELFSILNSNDDA